MKLRYNYRIYPTKQQQQSLAQTFGCARVVWNDALAVIKGLGDGEKWPSNGELQKRVITQAKKTVERQWLSGASNVILQQSVRDLGVAFSNWLASHKGKRKGRKVGFPRFKKRTNEQSIRYVGFNRVFWLTGNKLKLSKLGLFKVVWSRPLPSEPSSVTVTKNTAGQYHVSFVVEIDVKQIEPSSPSVGINLGIKTFAHLSTGERALSPDYSKLDRKIRRLQRRLCRQVKGSKRREQTRVEIAKLKLKTRNIRKDFLHKLSTRLVHENQVVCLEDLNVSGMVKNRRLARAISQQGWSEFRTLCDAKSRRVADRELIIISRWEPTSQTCSECGYRWGKLDLSVREVVCVNCGAHHDRDENAAKNIELVGVGHTHDIKRAMNGHKTRLSGNPIASLSHEIEQPLKVV